MEFRRHINLLFILIILGFSSYGQLPFVQSLGSDSTMATAYGGITSKLALLPPTFTDTTDANNGVSDQFPGNIIWVNGTTYIRSQDLTAWISIGSTGPGGTPYTDEQAQDAIGSALSLEFNYDDAGNSISIDHVGWSKITSTPITIAGYGITDAMSTSLTNGKIWIGNGSGIAAPVTPTGDITITNTGVTTIGAGKVSNSKLVNSNITVNSNVWTLGGVYTLSLIAPSDTAAMLSPYLRKTDTAAMLLPYLRSNIAAATYLTKTDTAAMLLPYLRKTDTTAMLSPYLRSNVAAATYYPLTNPSSYISNITGLILEGTNITIDGTGTPGDPYVINSTGGVGADGNNYLTSVSYNGTTITFARSGLSSLTMSLDTSAMLSHYLRSSVAAATYLAKTDTSAMLSPYLRKIDTTAMLSPYARQISLDDSMSIARSLIKIFGVTDTVENDQDRYINFNGSYSMEFRNLTDFIISIDDAGNNLAEFTNGGIYFISDADESNTTELSNFALENTNTQWNWRNSDNTAKSFIKMGDGISGLGDVGGGGGGPTTYFGKGYNPYKAYTGELGDVYIHADNALLIESNSELALNATSYHTTIPNYSSGSGYQVVVQNDGSFLESLPLDSLPAVNIYNTDGSLTGDRTVHGDEHTLNFDDVNIYDILDPDNRFDEFHFWYDSAESESKFNVNVNSNDFTKSSGLIVNPGDVSLSTNGNLSLVRLTANGTQSIIQLEAGGFLSDIELESDSTIHFDAKLYNFTSLTKGFLQIDEDGNLRSEDSIKLSTSDQFLIFGDNNPSWGQVKYYYDAGLATDFDSYNEYGNSNHYNFSAYRNLWRTQYDSLAVHSLSTVFTEADSALYRISMEGIDSAGSQSFLVMEQSSARNYLTLGYNPILDSTHNSFQIVMGANGLDIGARTSGNQFDASPSIEGLRFDSTGTIHITTTLATSSSGYNVLVEEGGIIKKVDPATLGGGGGGGSISFGTVGQIPFMNSGGTDFNYNANFTWDNTNTRLGIGTASPNDAVDITGGLRINNSGTLTAQIKTIAIDFPTAASNARINVWGGNSYTYGGLYVRLTKGNGAGGIQPFTITSGTSDYGLVGIGSNMTSPTALLQLGAGTATAHTAPLKFTSGTLLSVVEAGAEEFDGSHLYISIGSGRYQLDQQATSNSYSATLTNTTGITSSSLIEATYIRVGNIVEVTITGSLTPSVTTKCKLTFSLPFTTSITTQNYVVGMTYGDNGDATFVSGHGSITSGTTGFVEFIPTTATSGNFEIHFNYIL